MVWGKDHGKNLQQRSDQLRKRKKDIIRGSIQYVNDKIKIKIKEVEDFFFFGTVGKTKVRLLTKN